VDQYPTVSIADCYGFLYFFIPGSWERFAHHTNISKLLLLLINNLKKMGFTHIWTLKDELVHEISSLKKDESDTNDSWIVVDWSNMTMCLLETQGGHILSILQLLQSICGAIATSGHKICLVKDGMQDALRFIIKLDRMLETVAEREYPHLNGSTDCIESQCVIPGHGNDAALLEFIRLLGTPSKMAEKDAPDVKFILHRAAGEADPDIRKFA
jgi:hypothetical protein